MGLMPLNDAMFLVSESREQPMHVGGLQLFDLPDGAGPDHLAELYRAAVSVEEVAPLFRKRAHRSPLTLGQWAWADDRTIDLQHHVRHSALPRPGRVRELLALTSRLHGTPLDRTRPLWEAHLVEGLTGNRFAVYTKVHHALMDGISAMRLLQRSLTPDPDDRSLTAPWQARPKSDQPGRPHPLSEALAAVVEAPRTAVGLAGSAVGLVPVLARLAQRGLTEQATALPLQAPRSPFNVSISASRRFAAESWSLDRVKAVARAGDATVNDVVLAMCSGALRSYLQTLDALPTSSLVAMTPVSLRTDDGDGQGNAVGAVLCHLGTDLDDPAARLTAVRASMQRSKDVLRGLDQVQATALGAAVMAPLLLNSLVALHKVSPPPFNLVISNVPGPQQPMWWNGARLSGMYPLSIPTHGQALNITVTSYDGRLQFGLTGCRRSVPHLQRLLTDLEESLAGLEAAVR